MNALYFLRQPFTNDPKDTWRIASGRAFDFMPEADRMAVVPAADLAAAQQEIARLRAALSALELSANTVARCYTHRPENFAAALQSLEDDAAAAREALNK